MYGFIDGAVCSSERVAAEVIETRSGDGGLTQRAADPTAQQGIT
jgi:hypothetical protein